MGWRRQEFKQRIADAICERIARGQSLRSICKLKRMPSASTVYKWLLKHSTFAEQYARAREAQADTFVGQIMEIADTPQIGVIIKKDAKGTTITKADMIEHRRLQIDARKWVAARLAPKKYGVKVDPAQAAALQLILNGADADG